MSPKHFGGWSGLFGGATILGVIGGVIVEFLHYRFFTEETFSCGGVYANDSCSFIRGNNYWDWDVFLVGSAATFVIVVLVALVIESLR